MSYKIRIKVKELMSNWDWEKVCIIKWINMRSVNEWMMDSDEEIEFTKEEAQKIWIL